MSEREAFEYWFSGGFPNCRSVERKGEGYKYMSCHSLWQAWEASAKAEREACAKVCRAFGKTLEVDVGEEFAEEIMARSSASPS